MKRVFSQPKFGGLCIQTIIRVLENIVLPNKHHLILNSHDVEQAVNESHAQSQRVRNRIDQRGLLHTARTQRDRNTGTEVALEVATINGLGACPRVEMTEQ